MTLPFASRWPLAPQVIDYIASCVKCTPNEACVALQARLLDGTVRARGPIVGARAAEIDAEFWRFALPAADGQVVNLETLKKLPWFEVCAAEVLETWPVDRPHSESTSPAQRFVASSSKPRGRKPETLNRVVEAMRQAQVGGVDLAAMLEKEMAAKFGASRDTCRRASAIILSGKVGN